MSRINSKEKSGLRRRILIVSLVPVLILGFIITVFSYFSFGRTVEKEVRSSLGNIAKATLLAMDSLYPGDYHVVAEGDIGYLYKGDTDIMLKGEYLDDLSSQSGVDIILFYKDVAVLSTLKSENTDKQIVANKNVVADCLNTGEAVFYTNSRVDGVDFYAYYYPVINSDGECVGMLFAGKPSIEIRKDVLDSALPIMIIAIAMMIIISFFVTRLASELSGVIGKEKKFLGAIAEGNLRAELDTRIIARNDELGELGKFTVTVQRYIKDMIERDALTRLYSRRIGIVRIREVIQEYLDTKEPYYIAMGDIDFFKQFNDKYGHDCGDLVLTETASFFIKAMYGKGFTIRWGGEEFLMVFQGGTFEEAADYLEGIRKSIEDYVLEYEENKLNITMTFGIVEGKGEDLDESVKRADELLYIGKQQGRNRVISNGALSGQNEDSLVEHKSRVRNK